MSSREPYDDSFVLGPVPGGDVLFQPPGQVGQDGAEGAIARPAAPAPAAPAANRAVPAEYQEQRYFPQPPPPPGRPAEWGTSQVNIPPVAGPDPRTRLTKPAQRAAEQVRRWTPSKGSKKGISRVFLILGIIWLVFKIVLGIAIFVSEEIDNRAGPAALTPPSATLTLVGAPDPEPTA